MGSLVGNGKFVSGNVGNRANGYKVSGNRRTGGEEKQSPVLFLLKCLLLSYIVTAVLLLLLALLLYRLGLSEGVVSVAISAIYVVSTLAAGFVAGKKLETRKFLWGLLLGVVYFAVLAVISLMVNQSVATLGDSFFTTLTLCAAGGTLGGMMG